jgi:predicted ATPase
MRKAVRAALSTARTARTPGPLARYGQLVTKGRLRRDAAQVAVLEHLGRLHRVLAREREARDADQAARAVWATTAKEETTPEKECIIDPRAVGRKQELRKRRGTTGSEALDRVLNQSKSDEVYEPRQPRIPKGLYVHGHVGRGKSLCCDLFFEGLHGYKKRRVHFHQFMLEVHRRLHDARAECKRQHRRPPSTRDALKALGREFAEEAEVLVFDEMQITDANRGVPSCRGAFTSFKRVVSMRDCGGSSFFRF